jgi:hypothetical protein
MSLHLEQRARERLEQAQTSTYTDSVMRSLCSSFADASDDAHIQRLNKLQLPSPF